MSTGEGKKDAATHRLTGRAEDNRLVHFEVGSDTPRPGDVVSVAVTRAAPFHLLADALPDLDIRVAEPFVDHLPPSLEGRPGVRLQPVKEAVDDADIVVVLVDHDHFRSLSRSRLDGKIVYDTRGIWR